MTHGSVIFLVSHHCDKTLDMKQLGLELRGLHSVATVGEGTTAGSIVSTGRKALNRKLDMLNNFKA